MRESVREGERKREKDREREQASERKKRNAPDAKQKDTITIDSANKDIYLNRMYK